MSESERHRKNDVNMIARVIGRAAFGIAVLCLPNCTKSTINPNDSTAPQVQIKVKVNNSYQAMTSVDLHSGQQIDLMGVVDDPDGVRSLELTFSGSPANSCTVGSTVYNGSFSFPLPSAMQQTLQGDASGQVLNTLPLLASVTDPVCNVSGAGQGRPLGNTITVHATGKNWASNAQTNTATATLTIKIK